MAQEVEIEFKNLLTEEEFHTLLQHLPFPKNGKEQVNHYFETKDFQLAKQHAALRIREKNGKFQLTLKEPHPQGLLETHDVLTEQEAKNWLQGEIIPKPETLKQFKKMNIQLEDLIYHGALKTVRRETPYNDVLIVLDYSTYNNTEDYEFELEAHDTTTGKNTFETILNQFHIPKRNTPNKIQRFFNSKK